MRLLFGPVRRHGVPRRLGGAAAEALEARLVLSSWPAAPFHAADLTGAIYTNQFGDALVGPVALHTAGDFDAYQLRLAASGALRLTASGTAAPAIAFYRGKGAPQAIAESGSGGKPASLNMAAASVAESLYVAVRSAATAGAYKLAIDGPPAASPPALAIRADTHAGSASGAATSAAPCRFYSFTVPYSGDWRVSVAPSGALDVSIVVFDSAGKPVAGGFTSPIDVGGPGAAESWVAASLPAGGTYFVRVDARGRTAGSYSVKVNQTGLPVVSLATAVPVASEAMETAARITLKRAGASLTSPLTVFLTSRGTAAPGVDYAKVPDSVVIPAGRSFADMNIIPRPDSAREGDETVALSVRPSAAYIIGRRSTATVKIADSLASLPWPAAPFSGADFEGTVYVNQFGQAVITGRQLAAGDFDGYEVYFDDPGTLTVQTTGRAAAQLAFYGAGKSPIAVATPSAGNVNVSVSGNVAQKQFVYLGVRPVDGAGSGDYALHISGPVHGVVRPLDIDANTNSANWLTTISNAADADFYQFTTTEAGTWVISVQPTGYLDATLVVFDAAGNPVAGSFVKPIDAAGEGGEEKWIGRGIPAGTQLFARVDGRGESLGEYHIRVQHVAPPTVSVVASRPNAAEAGRYFGAFTISRDARSSAARPLVVKYAVYGEAVNGVDCVRLPGTKTIPAGAYSTVVKVVPIPDSEQEPPESLKIAILPDRAYRVSARDRAAVTITETRQLVWPAAPFRKGDFQAVLYPNQYGQITLSGQMLWPAYDIDGFAFAFDDAGAITIETTGNVPTHMALYHSSGRPVQTDEGSGPRGNARIVGEVPPDKTVLHVAVRAADGVSTGRYGLKVQGPPAAFVERLSVSPATNAAASGSDISGTTDCDFYTFTTTSPGNWAVTVIPDRVKAPRTPLDADLLVFDSAGRPVGGSFTAPLNAGGAGAAETWIGAALPGRATFFVRVGGHAGSTGGYGISVQRVDVPTVTIAAADSRAVEASRDTGRFTITRSDGVGSTFALAVSYVVGGSAANGTDYAAIPQSVVIPPGRKSVDIVIRALKDDLDEPPETVIIKLRASPAYKLGGQNSAAVTIVG